jgi:hypothetical protein
MTAPQTPIRSRIMSLKTWTRTLVPALLLAALPALSIAQVSLNISVNVPPPELPVYEQPAIPAEGYLWTPGYWAWDDDVQDYYWVPGTWVEAPQPGYLWTPGYWGWQNGGYLFNAGYWGAHVGFYGGVNYGYGYGGNGFEGGYWQGGHLYYNQAVTNVSSVHITNVYTKTVVNNISVTRVSFNGGTGGVRAEPNSEQLAAAHEQHIAAVPAQHQQIEAARSNPELRASKNMGKPPIAATARPGAFTGSGVVAAKVGGKVSPVHPASTTHGATGAQPAKEAGAAPHEMAPRPATKQTKTAPAEHAAPAERAAPAEHAPAVQHAAPVEHAPAVQHAAPVEHAPAVQHAAPVEHAPPVQHTAPAEHAPPVEHAAPAEHAAPVPHPAPAEHAAAPRPAAQPKPEAKPAPHPAEHPPERPEDRDHH